MIDALLAKSTDTAARRLNAWNPACWAASLPIQCCAITPRGGTLVDKQHVVFSGHYPLVAGAVVRFLDRQNHLIERTVKAAAVDHRADLGLARLDKPVSLALPKLSAARLAVLTPLLALQPCRAVVLEWIGGGVVNKPENPRRARAYRPAVSGHSGQPVFAISGKSLTLIGLYRTWFCDDGTLSVVTSANVRDLKLQIQKGIAS